VTTSQEPVLIVSHVSIDYAVRAQRQDSSTLARLLAQLKGKKEIVHAVKDVSFMVYRGETVGLIGTNGSGKSSLIRVIAGQQQATKGEVFASAVPEMLSVSNAMIKELSGARNIRIALLAKGFTPKQVREYYQEVINNSQVRDSIHFPVSTYSSGMKARLKFAISTVTAPEILLIDEALATGDAGFREQSERRLKEITDSAGAILMVNHNEKAIKDSCSRIIWLERGEIRMEGDPETVFAEYREHLAALKAKGARA
jgi:teichoic acid transport system ATP-binding protein